MSSSSKRKGTRAESEFAKLVGGVRVPLSGSLGGELTGDVKALGMTWEIKIRSDGFRELYKWLSNRDALAVRADRQEWLVVLPFERFQELIRKKEDSAA